MFIRALVVAFTVTALWWSSNSFGLGLGLGELKIDSHLASPLKANLTLRGINGIELDPEQLSIVIESDSKAKIEYRLLRIDSDTAIIQLYTREIISNPLFQFRVEVKWDRSAVSRSYDVLVDPPAYEEYVRNADEAGIAESVVTVPASYTGQADEDLADNQIALPEDKVIALSDENASETAAMTAPTEEPVGASMEVDFDGLVSQPRREYGPTVDGNSIWRVARAVATDNPDLTIYQWMHAIWSINPDAFTRNNMHRLQIKEILDIPFEDQVAETSHSAAWRAYSEQMAFLQSTSLVNSGPESDTTVGTVRDVAAIAEVQQMNSQQTVLAADALQPPNPGKAPINESTVNAEQESEMLAAKGSIIALLEKSASTIDEKSVVTRNPGVPGTTAETTMSMDLITADGPPAFDSNGTSSSAEVDSNETLILRDSLDAEVVGNSVSTAAVENDIAVDAALVAAQIQELPEWSRALQERYDHINQLPIIGTDGSLSFVGRSVQAADRFIATRPSWATLAFGIWVTLVLLMLRQEILTRRKTAVVASAAALPEALEADETAKQETADQNSVRAAGEAKQVVTPVVVPKASPIPSNAPAIIAQANAILARGDTEEAIKLMRLAVELQPDQPTLVIHLLELYHRTRNVDSFSDLLDRSRYVLEALDSRDQTRLEVMHAQLCPEAEFPLGRGEPVVNHEMSERYIADEDNAITKSEPVPGPVTETGMPSGPTAIDEDDASIPDQESEFDQHARSDGQAPVVSESDVLDKLRMDDNEDGEYLETQVIFTNNGVPLREEATPMPAMVGEIVDQETTLREADVYLAYGLYASAEELLLKGMEVDPERTDFLARLLDSYYATRNTVDFITCAEVMQDMGEAGAEYWERVEIMGYELAPDNNLFAGGKGKKLSPVELEFPMPATADFDFSDIDETAESAFTDIEITQDAESTLAESTFTDIQIGKYLDDDSESGDFSLNLESEAADLEFSDIDENGESALTDSEIAKDGESTFTDIQIDKYLDDNPEPDDLNLDLGSHELHEEGSSLLDGLISELDDSPEADESGMVDDDVSLEVSLAATADDFDPGLKVDLEAAEDELMSGIADEVKADDDATDLNYGDDDAIQFMMDEGRLGDNLDSEQFPPLDSDDASLVLVDDPPLDALSGVKLDSDNSRILYFPDSNNDGKDMDEFESEVKLTLQVIRDQLQNMTERLFHQERETRELYRTIAEMSVDSHEPGAKEAKKSS